MRHPHVELSSLDIDYAATCSHAVGLFATRGRRRLALLVPRRGRAGDLESASGFTAAAEKLKRGWDLQATVAYHDDTVAGLCQTLDHLRSGENPVTGILVAKALQVITAVSHLLRCGVKLPRDLSLISRDDDPSLEKTRSGRDSRSC